MNKIENSVCLACIFLIGKLCKTLGGFVDTANRVYNPNFISDTDASVVTDKALKRNLVLRLLLALVVRLILVFQNTCLLYTSDAADEL